MDHSEVKHLPKVDHTPAELDEASRVLLKAAALIEERGHCKGIQQDHDGRLCAYGAIVVAEGSQPATWSSQGNEGSILTPAGAKARSRFSAAINTTWIAEWNNHDARTSTEVVSKLRSAALGG